MSNDGAHEGAAAETAKLDDGYGQLLVDCWRAGPRPHTHLQVIERDDGFVSVEDAYRYFTPPGEWIEPERRAVELAHGRVLDVGCGAGRHATVMAQRGCEVVGIDPSPGAVKVATERGVDARLGTIMDPGDDVGVFDTIVLLGGNLGLLGSQRQATVALYRLATVAREGAQLLGIGRNPYATGDPFHLAYHAANEWRGLQPGQVRMRLRYKNTASEWFDRLLLSPEQLPDLLKPTPWGLDQVSGNGWEGFYLAEMTLTQTVRVLDHACGPICLPVNEYAPWMGCQALAAEIAQRTALTKEHVRRGEVSSDASADGEMPWPH